MAEDLETWMLIKKAQGGDQPAMERLCRHLRDPILAIVRSRLGPQLREKLESADIVQEVMIDALKRLPALEFRTVEDLHSYLAKIVENRIRDAKDYWSAQKRSPDHEVSLDARRSPDDSNPLDLPDQRVSTPSQIVVREEDLALLNRAMSCLAEESKPYHDLLSAVKIKGRTYRELAEAADSTEDAVRMRVRRAKSALTKIYTELEQKDGH